MKTSKFFIFLTVCVGCSLLPDFLSAKKIAEGVECFSASVNKNYRASNIGDCGNPGADLQFLAIDLSKVRVEPIFAPYGRQDKWGHPRYIRKSIGAFASITRRTQPQQAVAAINGGFFPFTYPEAYTNSYGIDIFGMEHLPRIGVLEDDQRCRVNSRWQLILADTPYGYQEPAIKPQCESCLIGVEKAIGGGGKILPSLRKSYESYCTLPGPPPRCNQNSIEPDPEWDAKNERTAVGYNLGGGGAKMIMATVVGSSGVTIPQMAEIMKSLGATDAVAFDGGGSTQMWTLDTKTGVSSQYGGTRPLVSALVVYAMPVRNQPPPPPQVRLSCNPNQIPSSPDKKYWCLYGKCIAEALSKGITPANMQQGENAAYQMRVRHAYYLGQRGGDCSQFP